MNPHAPCGPGCCTASKSSSNKCPNEMSSASPGHAGIAHAARLNAFLRISRRSRRSRRISQLFGEPVNALDGSGVVYSSPLIMRRIVLAVLVCVFGWCASEQTMAVRRFDLTIASVADINTAFEAGALTSERLTQLYLARIEAYNRKGPQLNAVLRVSPDALVQARALDAERRARGARGPLHGIPVLIKDNIQVAGLPTTAGF